MHTMSLRNLSFADSISKVHLIITSTEKLKENKSKLYKNFKNMKSLLNCTRETSYLIAMQKQNFFFIYWIGKCTEFKD